MEGVFSSFFVLIGGALCDPRFSTLVLRQPFPGGGGRLHLKRFYPTVGFNFWMPCKSSRWDNQDVYGKQPSSAVSSIGVAQSSIAQHWKGPGRLIWPWLQQLRRRETLQQLRRKAGRETPTRRRKTPRHRHRTPIRQWLPQLRPVRN